MKKNLFLLVLCLLSIVPMSAVVYYQPAGMSMERTYPSCDFKADTPFLLGNPREHFGSTNPWGGRTYLTPSGMKGFASENGLYVFVATGETDQFGEPTYLLKNVESGLYLSNAKDITKYTNKMSEAQALTVMPAVFFNAVEDGGKYSFDWSSVDYDIRTATLDIDTNNLYPIIPDFTEGKEKSFVITLANTVVKKEDGSQSAYFMNSPVNGTIRTWQDTNCWVLFEPEEAEGFDGLNYAYWDLLGGKDFVPEEYPIGDGPGLYPEDLLADAVDAWEVFSEYYNFGTGTQEGCQEAIQHLATALENLRNGQGSLKDGQYYRFWNSRGGSTAGDTNFDFRGCLYDGDGTMKWTPTYTAPDMLDVEASKYVWQLQVIDGKNYFQNYYTKRYMGDSNAKGGLLYTTEKPVTDWRIEDASDLIPGAFRIRGNQSNEADRWSLNTNCNGYTICYWQSNSDKASLWKVETMDSEQLKVLDEQIAQDARNKTLSALVEKSENLYNKGFAYTQYLTGVDQLSSNAVSENSGDGTLADAVDRNFGTLYHTNWRTEGNLGQPHWIQVELPEPLSEFTLDMVRRKDGNDRGAVTTWGVAGTNDAAQAAADDFVADDLKATLAGYQKWDVYQTASAKYDQAYDDNGTLYKGFKASFDIKLPKPCKYVRFLGLMRNRDYLQKDTLETGEIVETIVYCESPKGNVYFNMAEMFVRSTEVDESISLINAVPQEVRDALIAAIEKAKAELESNTATQVTIDQLQEAYNTFLEKYPDPESLKKAVADAKSLLESAPVGTEVGYFPAGATEDLNRVISQVEGSIKDVMSADEVNSGKEELSDAIEALENKVILPEEGVYFLRNVLENGEGVEVMRYVGSFHTGVNTLRWADNTTYECIDSPCFYWQLTKNADNTCSLRSYGTNNYLYAQVNSRGGDVVAGPEKANLKFRIARDGQTYIPGQFCIMLNDTYGLNYEGTGRLVAWNPDPRTTVEFVEPIDDWSGDYTIEYQAEKPQIITLPFALNNDCIYPLLKLVGTFNGAFQFEEYEEDEVIPAGTPVLFYSDDKDFTTDAFSLTTDDLEELTYTTEAKNQNGMIGTLAAIKELPVGCGIFYNSTIIGSVEGEGVDANTGYFLTDVTTDHKGTLSIPYDDTVKSLEEGIQNAVVINNKTGRGTFNLMGQKVQGKLPAGLYIVNGKKYIVK